MSKGHGRSVISNEHPTGWVSAVAAYLFFFFFFPYTGFASRAEGACPVGVIRIGRRGD